MYLPPASPLHVVVFFRAKRAALVIVSASTIYHVLRIAYCVLRIGYCVKHNLIYVIFNDTVKEEISIGLAETMIMAPHYLGAMMVKRAAAVIVKRAPQ